MVGFSNYSYEPSLGTRMAAGKPNIANADVSLAVSGKLGEMVEDIGHFRSLLSEFRPLPQARVYHGSFFDLANEIPPRSIDALITSPPYLNNYHYVRNTRPQMFWLGMAESPADLKEMEQKSFGQFWQTVRSGPTVDLEVGIPELSSLVEELRSRNTEKGPYGGPGWANYAASYFNDCARFCRTAIPLMKSGGTAVVVIGNNILQGIEFPTDRFFSQIAEAAGFEVIELHEVRSKRTGNSIVNSSVRAGTVKQRTRLYETAVELRAPFAASS
jgi:DNA modification methylase